ncbi:hypothetical protein, partial [Bacteroides stercoris]|uniref:hypothetical protein n=1 Tax=Bacteroides stercoris TaxID=46506 RepID=UPI001C8C8044
LSFYHSLHFTFAFGLYKGHYTYPMVAQFSTGILAHFSISIYSFSAKIELHFTLNYAAHVNQDVNRKSIYVSCFSWNPL